MAIEKVNNKDSENTNVFEKKTPLMDWVGRGYNGEGPKINPIDVRVWNERSLWFYVLSVLYTV